MRKIGLFLILLGAITLQAQPSCITVEQANDTLLTITIDPQAHNDYGFSVPLTYALTLATAQDALTAWFRSGATAPWMQLPEKRNSDFFNGINAARFDSLQQKAFLSVAFAGDSDSLYLKITNASGASQAFLFSKICPYYDDRNAVVTASADDMAGWSMPKFNRALHVMRSFNLWVSCGINSGGANASTYRAIQAHLDSGYVEASCHSRSHPSMPYKDYYGEIIGNKQDIINNLNLPESFRKGAQEYVPVWIAPNGATNKTVDSLLSYGKFLVNRLYYSNYFGLPAWNNTLYMYNNIGVTRAFDPPSSQLGWGIGTNNIKNLNDAFDKALADRSVYHVMCHPNVVEWDKDYPWKHLEHISNRKNIWYASVGQLYLYHLAQSSYAMPTVVAERRESAPEQFQLLHNYPNPFNPATTIRYELKQTAPVRLRVFNALGQSVAALVDQTQSEGVYQIQWRAENLPGGVYLAILETPSGRQSQKMLLVR